MQNSANLKTALKRHIYKAYAIIILDFRNC